MIRPIDIRLNAAHPELPLSEAFTFTGSPSTVLVRNVPPNCGRWAITSVNVAATFPDGSTTTRAAVQSANGVWVATLPATATSGRTANGLRIMADGIDENGEVVTGYILGVADFAVASLGITPAPEPGATSYPMLYFDTAPSVLRKGDVTKIDGVLKFYDGTAWLPFAEIDPSDYVPTSRTINGEPLTDNVSLSGSDIPTTAAPDSPTLANSISTLTNTTQTLTNTTQTLTNTTQTLTNTTQTLSDSISTLNNTKANKSDATLTPIYSDTPTFSEWTYEGVPDGWRVISLEYQDVGDPALWYILLKYDDPQEPYFDYSYEEGSENDTRIEFSSFNEIPGPVIATRVRTDIIGYKLGSQSDKPLQPKGDYQPAGDYPTKAQMDAGWWSEWTILRNGVDVTSQVAQLSGFVDVDEAWRWRVYLSQTPSDGDESGDTVEGTPDDTFVSWYLNDDTSSPHYTATRHRVAAPVPTKPEDIGAATRAANPTAGNLAALDAQGNPTDSLIPAANVAMKGNIPYNLINKTVSNGAVTLDDRASNSVTISATLSPNTLTINFPTATSGKVRDFAMRLNIAAGVTAPEIAWPQGVTLENNGGEVPEIADGGTGGSSTILYFSETENDGTTAKFLVKGETLTAIAQA